MPPAKVVIRDVDDGDRITKFRCSLEHLPNQRLSWLVLGMSFAREHDLERTGILSDGAETVQIREDEVGSLVLGRAACKANGGDGFRKFRACGLNLPQQTGLGFSMSFLNFPQIDTDGAAQVQIVVTPLRDMKVE